MNLNKSIRGKIGMSFIQSLIYGFPSVFWILLAVAAVASAVGFIKYVYFIGAGYGFSVAGIGLALLVVYGQYLTVFNAVQLVLLIVYGIRLGAFILLRDTRSLSYRREQTGNGTRKTIPVPVILGTWIMCALMYTTMTAPVTYRLVNRLVFGTKAGSGITAWAGAGIMAAAILLEALADYQKSAAKKTYPTHFCQTGLYRIVRCPNYFAELLFWSGLFLSGIRIYVGAVQWTIAILEYLFIIYVMFSGTKRLERHQDARYGSDPSYRAYIKKTPILIPLIPIRSLKNWKFIKP